MSQQMIQRLRAEEEQRIAKERQAAEEKRLAEAPLREQARLAGRKWAEEKASVEDLQTLASDNCWPANGLLEGEILSKATKEGEFGKFKDEFKAGALEAWKEVKGAVLGQQKAPNEVRVGIRDIQK